MTIWHAALLILLTRLVGNYLFSSAENETLCRPPFRQHAAPPPAHCLHRHPHHPTPHHTTLLFNYAFIYGDLEVPPPTVFDMFPLMSDVERCVTWCDGDTWCLRCRTGDSTCLPLVRYNDIPSPIVDAFRSLRCHCFARPIYLFPRLM